LSGDYEELLETIREAKEQNNGRLDDQLVIQFFKEKLLSKPCQNQGFIVDGFPKTLEQAKDLFAGKLLLREGFCSHLCGVVFHVALLSTISSRLLN